MLISRGTTPKWKTSLGGWIEHAPRFQNEEQSVFSVSPDRLVSVDRNTGARQWDVRLPDEIYRATHVEDGPLIVSEAASRDLIALNKLTGEPLWNASASVGPWVDLEGRIMSYSDSTTVQRLDPGDGKPIWETVSDTPPIWDQQGRTFLTERLGPNSINLKSIDNETGAEKWVFNGGYFLTQSGPSGELFLNNLEHEGPDVKGANLLKLDPESGEVLWSRPMSGSVYDFPHVSNSGRAFLHTEQEDGTSKLESVDLETGKTLWSSITAERFGLFTGHGALFVCDAKPGQPIYLNKFEPETGQRLWSGPVDGEPTWVQPTRDGGVLYKARTEAGERLVRLDSTGALGWQKDSIEGFRTVTVRDDKVLLRTTDGAVQSLTLEEGQTEWEDSFLNPAFAALTPDGKELLIGEHQGTLSSLSTNFAAATEPARDVADGGFIQLPYTIRIGQKEIQGLKQEVLGVALWGDDNFSPTDQICVVGDHPATWDELVGLDNNGDKLVREDELPLLTLWNDLNQNGLVDEQDRVQALPNDGSPFMMVDLEGRELRLGSIGHMTDAASG